MSVVLGLLLLQVVVPVGVLADVTTGDSATPGTVTGDSATPGTVTGVPAANVGIRNPLKATSIQALIGDALTFVVNLLAIAGAIYIIWAGFMFVKAQGNPSEIDKAKKAFFNAIIGMAIILGAWGISMIIANTINRITNNNPSTLRPS